MKYLLDAHVLIWHRTNDSRLSLEMSANIEDQLASFAVSMVTFWELAIKDV